MITQVTEQMHLDEVEMQFPKDRVHTSLGFFFPFRVAHPAPLRGCDALSCLKPIMSQLPLLLIDLHAYAFSYWKNSKKISFISYNVSR